MACYPEPSEEFALTQSDPTAFSPPGSFGPFRVLHQIGTGVLGPVFRTYEPARDRLVAVKVFRLDLTPEQARDLADELQRLVDLDLDHPSIVRPIGAGLEGTTAYYATEYVAAESLDIALRHYAPAAMDKVLPFITQLAGAIDFARTAGIGHGGLHPRDIFVTPEDARATGFGIVQALDRLEIRAPVRRPYTAPERVAGDPAQAWDLRADVFSLAAITFELITGRRPVGPQVDDLGSTAGPHASHVAAVLARGLAESPGDRFETALAFAAALEAASRGERTTGAIEEVRAVAGAAGTTTVLGGTREDFEEGEPAFQLERDLEFDRDELDMTDDLGTDVEVEREDDLAEIQLREDEALLRERADTEQQGFVAEADAQPGQEVQRGPVALPELRREPETRPEPERLDQAAGSAEPEPGPRYVPFEFPAAGEPEPAPEPERLGFDSGRFAGSRDVTPPRDEDYADRAVYAEPGSRPRRSVFVPIALTLLLGLFVGFLAGYLVGARDPGPGSSAEFSEPTAGPAQPSPQPADARREESPPPEAQGRTDPAARAAPQQGSAPAGGGAPAPSAPAATARPAAQSRLVVRSTPPGAQVYLDGRRRGTTPLTLGSLPPGTYTIRVSRSGYREQTQRVAVQAGGARDLTFRLERTPAQPSARAQEARPQSFTGSLYVDSRPRGATVLINGRAVGTTPVQLGEIPAGSHVVRLELAGHRTWTTSTRVVAGEVVRVTGSLEPQP